MGTRNLCIVVAGGLVIAANGCDPEMDVAKLKTFQERLSLEFETAPPGLEYRNGHELVLSFEDGKFWNLTRQERAAHSECVARFSFLRSPLGDRFDRLVIGYVRVDSSADRARTLYQVSSIQRGNNVDTNMSKFITECGRFRARAPKDRASIDSFVRYQ